jgi:signal transduction histidine kinase
LNEATSNRRFASNEVLAIREARRYRLVFFMLSIGVPVLLGFGFGDLFHGNTLEAFFNFFISAVIAISILVLKRKRTQAVVLSIQRVVTFILGVLFLYYIFSSHQQEYKVLWSYPYPFIVYFMFGKREGIAWMLVFYGLTVSLFLMPFVISDLPGYNNAFSLRFLISFAIVGVLSHIFFKTHEATQQLLEAQYQQLLDSENRYRTAYETLKETQAQLVQSGKLAAIGQLAAGVAHELNQPLMVARTNAQFVLRELDKEAMTPENMRERIQFIEKCTKRMMNIINHLRTFSRQSQEAFSPVDINSVVTNGILMMGEQLRVHNVELRLELAEHLPKVMGNANQLEQVFLNIITNARDAVLEARTDESTKGLIEVSTGAFGKNREWVEVLVRDTGKGLDRKDLDRIFEPFFTTKEVGKGTGLGLSISHGIVKEHGGTISVTGTGSEGTVFSVHLPIID